MVDSPIEIVRLMSVILTREKQLPLEKEFERYAEATNYVIKAILKHHLMRPEKAVEVLAEPFGLKFDKRGEYLRDVIKTARAAIVGHQRLAGTVRSMRNKPPFFKSGRMILSQPIVKVGESAVLLRMPDKTQLPIPYDKRSRNRESEVLTHIVKGERDGRNKRYERVRMTWNKEGFVNIDIRARLYEMKKRD